MLQITKMLAVVCVVVGLTSSAPAQWTHWHNAEHPPVTTGNLWSDDANWTDGTPAAGWGFRIEQYDADAAGTGAVLMDVDYSADALNTAQFFGTETVLIQEYFKADTIWLNNGGNAPNGAYISVGPTGTIWGNVIFGSEVPRNPPVIDFAGGDWLAGNVTTGGQSNRQGGIIKVSATSGVLTPGNFNVSQARSETFEDIAGFEFALAADGVAPINLTDGDPLQWTGGAAGTQPFRLMVDASLYTGPAGDIPLFIFDNADTDRMFAAANITIDGVPVDWVADVEQTDDGVTLSLTMLTVPGDLSGDGDVDIEDVGLFEAQFGSQAPGTYTADFDEDGDVDLDDFKIMRDYWGAVAAAPAGAATPEPATMTLLAIGGLMVFRGRRRRKA